MSTQWPDCNISESLTQRHPELVSGSLSEPKEMLK